MSLRFTALHAVLLTACALSISIAVSALPAYAQDKGAAEQMPAMSTEQRGAIEEVVRDYLLTNPEIIVEAIRIFREREQLTQASRAKQALSAHKDMLMHAKGSPEAGNPKGDVTVVEFFDYQCGYCKRMFPLLSQLLDKDKNLRWVFKEFPILGPDSMTASQAALAAWNLDQSKYLDFHAALMAASGALPEDRVLKIAQSVGYDAAKLREAMKSEAVTGEIARNHQLAETLNIRGTPAFIVGDELVPGAVDLDTLRQLIRKARKG